uniref:INO80 complex subunit E n=1 Tax=Myotis myotis TaxID=51298 RepID=A0A7J7XZM3_MYOMY|nr:INO80 complex subunit E [Myotis myotis]
MNGPADGEVDYKKKYRNLKRKLKFLIYEHECFQEELRKAQRKLLKVSRDKSFLLDRLLQYENVDEDSSDSDATASSDNSETEGTPKLSDTPAPKRKRSPPMGGAPSPSSLSLPPSAGFPLQASGAPSPYLSSQPRPLFRLLQLRGRHRGQPASLPPPTRTGPREAPYLLQVTGYAPQRCRHGRG